MTSNHDVLIGGGGPAGMMAGYLLARAGVSTKIIEKHGDFFRDFRGDTVHPSTMEILAQLGLLERFLKRPHNQLTSARIRIGGREWTIGDLSHLDTPAPFIAMMPQWDFLDFLRDEARAFPAFTLAMDEPVIDFILAAGRVTGVRYASGREEYAGKLVIAADGRSSLVRQRAMLPVEVLGAPMDVLWFRVAKNDDGGDALRGSVEPGRMVVLIDRDQESADKGKAHVQKGLTDQVNKGRATAAQRDAALARITATADYAALGGVDLIVEAVFEDRKVKAEATARAQAIVPDVIFGSNTSTLPITSLAESAKDQAKFIGIHFFSPVERMMLVEIIMGKNTGDAALALALDFVRAIRKTPIVVNDSRGFYTSRVVGTYLREGHLMLAEGIPAAMIENVGRMAGMPVGPLSLNDEVAVDLAWKIVKATEADLGASAVDLRQKALLEFMVEKKQRLGRKNGKGFYDYPEKGPKKLWPGLAEMQSTKLDPDTIDVQELKDRFLAMQALETARCFEEGVLTDVREADVRRAPGDVAAARRAELEELDPLALAAEGELHGAHVDAVLAPGYLGRVTGLQLADLVAVDGEAALGHLDLVLEHAPDGVVLEEEGHGLAVAERVVDRHQLHPGGSAG